MKDVKSNTVFKRILDDLNDLKEIGGDKYIIIMKTIKREVENRIEVCLATEESERKDRCKYGDRY
jgi:hypothetical protein